MNPLRECNKMANSKESTDRAELSSPIEELRRKLKKKANLDTRTLATFFPLMQKERLDGGGKGGHTLKDAR